MDPLLFEFLQPDPHLSLDAGALLTVDLLRARMWTRDRILQPNYGYLAGLLADGRIEWITPSQTARRPAFPIRVA